MIGIRTGLKALAVLGAMSLTAACASYPTEPRYPIYADGPAPARQPSYPAPATPAPGGEGVRGPTNPAYESAPTSGAPVSEIEGGALDAPVGTNPYQPAAGPASPGRGGVCVSPRTRVAARGARARRQRGGRVAAA